ncbi:MAG TPA: crotonase/enoyl-CoA hydratase family protein [Beijerinckiaceae bacterium]|nr:crotonase/enoyl-CoA hydratase family protein [Beijerinckiaceae bacterium]
MARIDLPPTLKFHQEGPVGVIALARPEKRNALDDETILGLQRLFSELPDAVRSVVLHGEGTHFSAGLDLSEVADAMDLYKGVRHSQMWHRAFNEIQFGRVPVFTVLHGAVVGGGLELAASTHVRIAEPSAYYALPEGQRGIFLGGGGSVRITRLIGVPAVQDLMLTGRTLSAEEGHVRGVSQYLVKEGEGMARAMELAQRAATNAPVSNFAILNALPHIAESNPGSGFFTESLMASIAEHTPEARQRLKDFLEKRAAKVLHTKDP